jgi:hypothetical protein
MSSSILKEGYGVDCGNIVPEVEATPPPKVGFKNTKDTSSHS